MAVSLGATQTVILSKASRGPVSQPEDRMVAQASGLITAFALACIAGLIAMTQGARQ